MKRAPSRTSSIKTAQRESLIFRFLARQFTELAQDNVALRDLSLSSVKLSPGKTLCYVYFYSDKGESHFREVLPELTLYKPSMRKALAQELDARYAVDLLFKFDAHIDKVLHIEKLLDQVKEESSRE